MTEIHNQARKREELKLSASGFRDIRPEELPDYIKEAKTAMMGRLLEHLDEEGDKSELQSLAFSIGILSELERIVDHWRNEPQPGRRQC
jgi:hypothetical protein